ncbi:MAG: flagellar hook-basal body complex protein FliE [Phycisphaeraceae bacterium]|nr:flagellar hook-basal body complex protein FliE [Phycisphaeraceae bacterium]
MADPLGFISGSQPIRPPSLQGGASAASGVGGTGGASFKDALIDNIKRVDELQQQANRSMEDIATGKRDDLEGVILATQQADSAFRMLQAVRNRVMEAYDELKQTRV